MEAKRYPIGICQQEPPPTTHTHNLQKHIVNPQPHPSCVLPSPGPPQTSVICCRPTPPPRMLSSPAQKVMMRWERRSRSYRALADRAPARPLRVLASAACCALWASSSVTAASGGFQGRAGP